MNAALPLSFDAETPSASSSSTPRKTGFPTAAGSLSKFDASGLSDAGSSAMAGAEDAKKSVFFAGRFTTHGARAEAALGSLWTQALQNAAMGEETALRAMIDEQPNLMWGASMDAGLADRLDLWAALLSRPGALDTATWTLVAHKSQSSLAGHAALFSLWARAAAHRQSPQRIAERDAPAAALVAADLLRAPFSAHDAQEAFALAWPQAAGGSFLAPEAAQHRYANPWMTLAFMAQKDAFAARQAIEMISRADFQQSVADSYLPMLMWDPLALSLAWSVLLRRDASESTLSALEFALGQDLRSIRDLSRESLAPFLRGAVPEREGEIEPAAHVLDLLERKLGHRVAFEDTKWEALRASLTKRELMTALAPVAPAQALENPEPRSSHFLAPVRGTSFFARDENVDFEPSAPETIHPPASVEQESSDLEEASTQRRPWLPLSGRLRPRIRRI